MNTTSTLDRRHGGAAQDADEAPGSDRPHDEQTGSDPGHGHGHGVGPDRPPAGAEPVLLHRRRGALALVGVGAAVAAAGYAWRFATGDSGLLGLVVAAVLAPIAVAHLAAWWDARVPLLVADETGIRLREGATWSGLRWDEVADVRLAPQRLPRRDARLDVATRDGDHRPLPLALVDPADLRALPEALRGLAPVPVDVLVAEPTETETGEADAVLERPDPVEARPDEDAVDSDADARADEPADEPTERTDEPTDEPTERTDEPTDEPTDESTEVTETSESDDASGESAPAPAGTTDRQEWFRALRRRLLPAARSSRPAVTVRTAPDEAADDSTATDSGETGNDALDTAPTEAPTEPRETTERVEPDTSRDRGAARADVSVEPSADGVGRSGALDERELRDSFPGRVPLVLEETPVVAASTPDPVLAPAPEHHQEVVIGAQLVQARRRLRLGVDDLAERTRIRPHVIEAVEEDDFSACGGDVYARGHLRVLARVLGIDADVLVQEYDRRYSTGPVTARKVFEAELAGPGRSMRTTNGGPRWSVLVGVVLVLVLLWSLVRLFAPSVADSPGGNGQGADRSSPRATATAAAGSTEDAAALFAGMGQRVASTRLRLVGTSTAVGTPVTVRTADGAVVFRGSIGAGESERLQVAGAATVIAADAAAVTAQVNGRPVGPLGEAGKPVRRTLGG